MDGPTKIEAWAHFLKEIRIFLESKGCTEVTTPHLVKAGAFESSIDCLEVSWSHGDAELHSSPEIEMKKILARFPKSIYQICRSFRDDPATPIHFVEFTMLEFYRVGINADQLLDETLELIARLGVPLRTPRMISIPEFFQNNLGLDLAKLEKKEDFLAAARKAGNSSVTDTDGWEDLFFKLVLDEIETRLPHDEISVLTHYPTRVSPLSRPDHSGTYAERFEIYWHGMEIANGCTELWSAEELTRRYQKESQTRIENKKEPHPYPHDLIESAKSPLPLVSGIAIGLERLFYACELSRRL